MLYIVATPIGNLEEITLRALNVLKQADLIAAEDTRHTKILLDKYSIKKPMISYQKHNERQSALEIVQMLKEGKDVALVSDAGMPLISDPGQILVNELIQNNLEYTVISGPSACINALVLSGFDSRMFLMAGFLPFKNIDRLNFIQKIKDVEATLILYSAPHDINDDLTFLYEHLGARKVAVVREISKIYEQTVFGILGQDIAGLNPRGEMVIIIEGARPLSEKLSGLTILEHVEHYMKLGKTQNEAIKAVAKDKKIAKSQVYSEVVKNRQ